MRYSSICGAKICYPSASGTPRTLSGRWCGNVRALLEDHGVHLPKKTPVTTAGRASKKTPYIRVASPHFLRNNSYIILHPWINEICAQQIGSNRDFHAFPNPSKSKYGSFPIYHHLLRCFSHEKQLQLLGKSPTSPIFCINLHIFWPFKLPFQQKNCQSHLVTSSDKRCSCCCRAPVERSLALVKMAWWPGWGKSWQTI